MDFLSIFRLSEKEGKGRDIRVFKHCKQDDDSNKDLLVFLNYDSDSLQGYSPNTFVKSPLVVMQKQIFLCGTRLEGPGLNVIAPCVC